jgi:glycosyltransferase involved in cell wall biosynthesis
MKIFINAYNLIKGGGLSIGKGVLQSLYDNKYNSHTFYVYLPDKKLYPFQASKNIQLFYIPKIFTKYLIGRPFVNFYLQYKIKQLQPDAIFSMGNYAIPTKTKQLLLLHWPYALYRNHHIWQKMTRWNYIKRKFRLWYFKKNLKFATQITVQTQVIKERFLKLYPFRANIHIVPSSFNPGLLSPKNQPQVKLFEDNPSSKFLLCLSEYYEHKNLEILLPLALLFRENQNNFKIITTIDPKDNIPAQKFLKTVKKNGLEDTIINIGRTSNIGAFYQNCHALFLPTLLETFGLPYLEAMYAGLPVFTSDRDFAKEVCKDAAFYFDPLDAVDIYQCIMSSLNDNKILEQKSRLGKSYVTQYKTWEDITKEYIKIIESL